MAVLGPHGKVRRFGPAETQPISRDLLLLSLRGGGGLPGKSAYFLRAAHVFPQTGVLTIKGRCACTHFFLGPHVLPCPPSVLPCLCPPVSSRVLRVSSLSPPCVLPCPPCVLDSLCPPSVLLCPPFVLPCPPVSSLCPPVFSVCPPVSSRVLPCLLISSVSSRILSVSSHILSVSFSLESSGKDVAPPLYFCWAYGAQQDLTRPCSADLLG